MKLQVDYIRMREQGEEPPIRTKQGHSRVRGGRERRGTDIPPSYTDFCQEELYANIMACIKGTRTRHVITLTPIQQGGPRGGALYRYPETEAR